MITNQRESARERERKRERKREILSEKERERERVIAFSLFSEAHKRLTSIAHNGE